MGRPYIRYSIYKLEDLYSRNSNNPSVIRSIDDELNYRRTKRAIRLKAGIRARHSLTKDSNIDYHIEVPAQKKFMKPLFIKMEPLPKLTNDSTEPDSYENILSAWTVMEVLSPITYTRPEGLAAGDRSRLYYLNKDQLPWESGEHSRKNYRLYYQVVLGSIDLAKATSKLLEEYGDDMPDNLKAKNGSAAIATIILDKNGNLIESPFTSVSSFCWGLKAALEGDLSVLSQWPRVERELNSRLEKYLSQRLFDGEKFKPLDRSIIFDTYNELIKCIGIPEEFVEQPEFGIRSYVYYTNNSPPSSVLVNSFYINDLGWAMELISNQNAPENLKKYLGIDSPPQVIDLLDSKEALREAVSPKNTPLSKWPNPGNHPLNMLQRAAINSVFNETMDGGIIGINGPPGTGKTTLLKDVVANIVFKKAEVLAEFNDPEDAFVPIDEKIKAGNAMMTAYKLDPRLKGFEIVVASSNNKAVENVSESLPKTSSIASDISDLRYFKTVSDKLNASDTWGLVAAVLGNSENRYNFKNDFWWNFDSGMSSYLSSICGKTNTIMTQNEETGENEVRYPKIIEAENAPSSHEEALIRWNEARRIFKEKRDYNNKLRKWHLDVEEVTLRLEIANNPDDLLLNAETNIKISIEKYEEAQRELSLTSEEKFTAEKKAAAHKKLRKGIFKRLFNGSEDKAWKELDIKIKSELQRKVDILIDKAKSAKQALKDKLYAENRLVELKISIEDAKLRRLQDEAYINEIKSNYSVNFVDAEHMKKSHEEMHNYSPWHEEAVAKANEDLFVASMNLHKAFVDAAARPLRSNVGLLMKAFSSNHAGTKTENSMLSDFWSSLFLIVPVISTTFASFERMFGGIPKENLGWLLIDEAGQALPQAAVGCIIRSKRVVAVGDPAQLEPIVSLPTKMVNVVCDQFQITKDDSMAPSISVQGLVDRASKYQSKFQDNSGSRSTGAPLLVHRRCVEPMFSISNNSTYSGLMINATDNPKSTLAEKLGPSRWIHVDADSGDKWSSREGDEVLNLLRIIRDNALKPDIYIITPFVMVADQLRKIVIESNLLDGLIEMDVREWAYERIGTVHTAQGREASAVIFVLGAPSPQHSGARNWAGSKSNLLNVAVTRAKEAIYVIGNRSLWKEAGVFSHLDYHMPIDQEPEIIQDSLSIIR